MADSKNTSGTVLAWLMAIGGLGFAAWWLLPDNYRIKYAAEYMLDPDQVVIEREPHNCDWDSAPLGNKHCHYEAIVTTLNSAGAVVESGGKQNTAVGDQNVAKVHVDWERVED
jgi:hypothetical protein